MEKVSAKVGEVQRKVLGLKSQLSDCCPKVKKDLTNLTPELARLKEEITTMKPKADPLAQPAVDTAVSPAPEGSSLGGGRQTAHHGET
jgi:hypothetical protein